MWTKNLSVLSYKHLNYNDNYRGISLCWALCKLIDYVFIEKSSVYLKSSDMQFAFKSNNDTALCTATLRETVSYYLNRGLDVYACILDTSKTFNNVHFGIMQSRVLVKLFLNYC